MKNFVKHLASFILPITVLIIVPVWIEQNISLNFDALCVLGLLFMAAGLFILVSTIAAFIKIGKGTLAPWSPTKNLIIGGIYGHVRNPMISGVFITLLGESLAFSSEKILLWAIIFFFINHFYFMVYEEPNLEKRFGEAYRKYKKHVPRWVPTLKSFKPGPDL